MSGKKHTLYRIWYSEHMVYLGRTSQPLQDRLRGHFFGRPMHRKIDLANVTRIDRCEFATEADMFVYEVYFINLYKPALNRDDLSYSALTVALPEVDWEGFDPPIMDKWRREIAERDDAYRAHQRDANELLKKSFAERGAVARFLRDEADEIRKIGW